MTFRRFSIVSITYLWIVIVLAVVPIVTMGQDSNESGSLNREVDQELAARLAAEEMITRAESGDAQAQYSLGTIYRGLPETPNYTAAEYWFRQAAEQDHANAQSALGALYAEGKGVPQDHSEAARWFQKAALQGVAEAQLKLGSLYFLGDGVIEDYVFAHMWFNISAANGMDRAADYRNLTANQMTDADISEAQRRARLCMRSGYQDCD